MTWLSMFSWPSWLSCANKSCCSVLDGQAGGQDGIHSRVQEMRSENEAKVEPRAWPVTVQMVLAARWHWCLGKGCDIGEK